MTAYIPATNFIDPTPSIASVLGSSLGTIGGKGINAIIQDQKAKQKEQLLRNALEQHGITGSLQDLYIYGTEGGRTDITKGVTDAALRNTYKPIAEQEEGLSNENLALQYEKNNFANLTPRETTIFRRDIAKNNQSYFKNDLKNYEDLKKQDRDLKILQNLNESNQLPSALGRLNVNNETVSLRFPFLASNEAQEYVKTLNRFFDGLKNTFGARITNLDVNLFAQRLPGLANSKEARRVILKQMDLVNQMNQIYYGKFRELYNKYKDRLSESQIETIVEKETKSQIDQLNQQYQEINNQLDILSEQSQQETSPQQDTFEQLPDAATEKGNTLEDETTGQRYRSNGTKWIQVS